MTSGTPPANNKQERGIILIPYPKIVFLYPVWLLSLVCGLYMYFSGDASIASGEPSAGTVTCGWAFLILLTLNMQVLAFDFPRATSLTLVFVVVAAVLGAALIFINFPNVFPAITDFLQKFRPQANSTFYLLLFFVFSVIYLAVAFNARFDYWEVRPNELLHHHGLLSDLKRYSAPHLRIDKEINDVFEYMLLGSGRLILQPSSEPRAIVLDNVFFISQKEAAITKLLGALQVQVREAPPK
jgi:hypothetical protein